ncbi:uncharacterized protein DNG_03915 [Cephalotrichum gorgonifer]|uniref:Uncharacterized protein n=1 Tax=Cephalotrichum gorgonifer TaxID=2041049 RepID=A0AAE8SU19_9PEZI|nr:uncharacterized protein DNG_03915 [Cephalotrichum gorgonifer]
MDTGTNNTRTEHSYKQCERLACLAPSEFELIPPSLVASQDRAVPGLAPLEPPTSTAPFMWCVVCNGFPSGE